MHLACWFDGKNDSFILISYFISEPVQQNYGDNGYDHQQQQLPQHNLYAQDVAAMGGSVGKSFVI